MDCRTFRKNHLEYLDDTLPGDLMAAAQLHLLNCSGCAAHDNIVRKSLFMVRNIASVNPSPDFRDRLNARLEQCRSAPRHHDFDEAFPHGYGVPDAFRSRFRVLKHPGSWLFFTGCLALAASLSLTDKPGAPVNEVAIQPVIASEPPEPIPSLPPLVSPELIQAMATGNPIWSMTLLVENAPAHLMTVSTE